MLTTAAETTNSTSNENKTNSHTHAGSIDIIDVATPSDTVPIGASPPNEMKQEFLNGTTTTTLNNYSSARTMLLDESPALAITYPDIVDYDMDDGGDYGDDEDDEDEDDNGDDINGDGEEEVLVLFKKNSKDQNLDHLNNCLISERRVFTPTKSETNLISSSSSQMPSSQPVMTGEATIDYTPLVSAGVRWTASTDDEEEDQNFFEEYYHKACSVLVASSGTGTRDGDVGTRHKYYNDHNNTSNCNDRGSIKRRRSQYSSASMSLSSFDDDDDDSRKSIDERSEKFSSLYDTFQDIKTTDSETITYCSNSNTPSRTNSPIRTTRKQQRQQLQQHVQQQQIGSTFSSFTHTTLTNNKSNTYIHHSSFPKQDFIRTTGSNTSTDEDEYYYIKRKSIIQCLPTQQQHLTNNNNSNTKTNNSNTTYDGNICNMNDAKTLVNLWALRELALSRGGLLNTDLRKRSWPILASLPSLMYELTEVEVGEAAAEAEAEQLGLAAVDSATTATATTSHLHKEEKHNMAHQKHLPVEDLHALQKDLDQHRHVRKDVEKFVLSHVISSFLLSSKSCNRKKGYSKCDITRPQQHSLKTSKKENEHHNGGNGGYSCDDDDEEEDQQYHYYTGLVDLASVLVTNLEKSHPSPKTLSVSPSSSGTLLLQRLAESHIRDALKVTKPTLKQQKGRSAAVKIGAALPVNSNRKNRASVSPFRCNGSTRKVDAAARRTVIAPKHLRSSSLSSLTKSPLPPSSLLLSRSSSPGTKRPELQSTNAEAIRATHFETRNRQTHSVASHNHSFPFDEHSKSATVTGTNHAVQTHFDDSNFVDSGNANQNPPSPRSVFCQFLINELTPMQRAVLLSFLPLLQTVDCEAYRLLQHLCHRYNRNNDPDQGLRCLRTLATVLGYYTSTLYVTATDTCFDPPHLMQNYDTVENDDMDDHDQFNQRSHVTISKDKEQQRHQAFYSKVERTASSNSVSSSVMSRTSRMNHQIRPTTIASSTGSTCSAATDTNRNNKTSIKLASRLVDYFLVSHPLMPVYFAVALVTKRRQLRQSLGNEGASRQHQPQPKDQIFRSSGSAATPPYRSSFDDEEDRQKGRGGRTFMKNSCTPCTTSKSTSLWDMELELHQLFQFRTLLELSYGYYDDYDDDDIDTFLSMSEIIEDAIHDSISFIKRIPPKTLIEMAKSCCFNENENENINNNDGSTSRASSQREPRSEVNSALFHDIALFSYGKSGFNCVDQPSWATASYFDTATNTSMTSSSTCFSLSSDGGGVKVSPMPHSYPQEQHNKRHGSLLTQQDIVKFYPLASAASGLSLTELVRVHESPDHNTKNDNKQEYHDLFSPLPKSSSLKNNMRTNNADDGKNTNAIKIEIDVKQKEENDDHIVRTFACKQLDDFSWTMASFIFLLIGLIIVFGFAWTSVRNLNVYAKNHSSKQNLYMRLLDTQIDNTRIRNKQPYDQATNEQLRKPTATKPPTTKERTMMRNKINENNTISSTNTKQTCRERFKLGCTSDEKIATRNDRGGNVETAAVASAGDNRGGSGDVVISIRIPSKSSSNFYDLTKQVPKVIAYNAPEPQPQPTFHPNPIHTAIHSMIVVQEEIHDQINGGLRLLSRHFFSLNKKDTTSENNDKNCKTTLVHKNSATVDLFVELLRVTFLNALFFVIFQVSWILR